MCNPNKTCLIIPCYNEYERLDVQKFLDQCSDELIFVFVNDGSTDATESLLRSHQNPNWYVLTLGENKGKGEAVRQGAMFIKENSIDKRVSWIGFWDSDLSVPLEDLSCFYRYQELFFKDAECIIGSRIKKMGSEILRSPRRHYLGRCFSTVVSLMFSIQFYDTQCGAKVIKSELLDICFTKPFLSDWIFDVELLMRLAGHPIIEYPLMHWQEKAGSKINFFKVMFTAIRDLIRMKKNLTEG